MIGFRSFHVNRATSALVLLEPLIDLAKAKARVKIRVEALKIQLIICLILESFHDLHDLT